MKLAISNIGWDAAEDEAVAGAMQEFGVTAVEVAPGKIWAKPLEASDDDIAKVRKWWNDRDINIVSMQAHLFGTEGLILFGNDKARQQLHDYTVKICELAAKLGVEALVFGAPKNRQRGDMKLEQAWAIAKDFFWKLGEGVKSAGVHVVLEPLPSGYECDFIMNTREGIDFVSDVNHPNFRLHLDIGALTMANDDFAPLIPEAVPVMRHSHISAPNLAPVPSDEVDYQTFVSSLKDNGYQHYYSIEMRGGDDGQNVERVRTALRFGTELLVG